MLDFLYRYALPGALICVGALALAGASLLVLWLTDRKPKN